MNTVTEVLPSLLEGLVESLKVTILSTLVALVLAFTAGLALISKTWLIRAPARIYVEVFRGTNALVQLFYFFYVLPLLGLTLSPLTAAVAALGMCFAAYGAEVVRSAVLAIDKGQWEACHALAFTRAQSLRRVIVPQALRRMLPPFGNLLVEIVKGTSLVSLVGISELTFNGRLLSSETGNPLLVYSLVMVLYFAAAFPLSLMVKRLERRLSLGAKL